MKIKRMVCSGLVSSLLFGFFLSLAVMFHFVLLKTTFVSPSFFFFSPPGVDLPPNAPSMMGVISTGTRASIYFLYSLFLLPGAVPRSLPHSYVTEAPYAVFPPQSSGLIYWSDCNPPSAFLIPSETDFLPCAILVT